MGYHRLLTHRGYKTPKWMEYFLTTCGTLALEGGPIFWVATHRIHHQHSDKDGDPHTPREGTFWAHMGWILFGQGDAPRHRGAEALRARPEQGPFHVALTTWHWVPQVVVGLGLLAYGGLPYVLWGAFLRTTFGLHGTWLVNSATHLWGSRRFRTSDDSTNNWWVALLSFGEGWHNNHHAHPVSMRHGLAWYEFDMNYLQIRLLETLGLAWDLKVARIARTPAKIVPQESPDAVDISEAGAGDVSGGGRQHAAGARARGWVTRPGLDFTGRPSLLRPAVFLPALPCPAALPCLVAPSPCP